MSHEQSNTTLAPRRVRPPSRPRTTQYDPEKQARMRAEIRERGAAVVAEEAGFALNTLTSLAAGNGCNESTKKLADMYLSSREPA